MTFRLKYTADFYEDLDRITEFLIEHDPDLAERAIIAIDKALTILEDFPLIARAVSADEPMLRELVIPFGSSGYVVLFRIDGKDVISVAAIRHQREDDYH
ncbi:type II toxin-antitoxin system RelE/ParE family toxin [Neorhizobium sp. JUb45]|uniref:type II toxin-antitoxin system RelE/ParE family toxin n=1 Tax=unclassified Neorhizobium TaxID=2629175 RepID=UPI0010509AE5|nr:type II toxin-antitoxin system RelE/ParE family toxin [Neorhizobium sp. JUb45]TCR03140.1 plasmid stabilization system protein ParE [Neorhizobium sp. JUb45]